MSVETACTTRSVGTFAQDQRHTVRPCPPQRVHPNMLRQTSVAPIGIHCSCHRRTSLKYRANNILNGWSQFSCSEP